MHFYSLLSLPLLPRATTTYVIGPLVTSPSFSGTWWVELMWLNHHIDNQEKMTKADFLFVKI